MDREMAKEARRYGLRLRLTKAGHYQFLDAQGSVLVTSSSTPSDWRAFRNLSAQLRRAASNKPKES